MKNAPPNFARLILIHVLRQLPADLQSRLLSDGVLGSRYNLHVYHPVRFSKNTVVKHCDLFPLFRVAIEGEPAKPLVAENGSIVDAEISVEADGTGVVAIGKTRF